MKKYSVIYADPPWRFGSGMYSKGKGGYYKDMEDHFPTMNIKQICDLSIKEISTDDCALFLWTTDAHLDQAIRVIESWGFKYKTVAFFWLKKEKTGKQVCFMGCWTMKCGEICLFATKGKMLKHLKSNNVRQLVEAERSRHSKKPNEVRNRIEKMFGDVPKIELFAREKTPGWDVWGNEVESDIELK